MPHGVYPCDGVDAWCAFSVWDDAEWTAFCDVVGGEWTRDGRFATVLGRKAHEAEIDERVAEWTRRQSRNAVVGALRGAGLRAAPVNSMADLFEDPQLEGRTWRPVDHPVLGRTHVMAPPFQLQETPAEVKRPAPLLGEHTREVLSEVLGVSDAEIDVLESEGVLD